MEEGTVSKPVAALACAAMALLYVAILYAPTMLLRLPHPCSSKDFLIRRFICAAISSPLLPAPLTKELVFRACMIPLLLCGGFKIYTVIFMCPVFFSLAHLNHIMEVYSRPNYNLIKASLAVALQLGYTLVFGSYTSFLFIRTGHLLAPLVAHVCCNYMGLPVLFSRHKGIISVAFLAGLFGFLWLLFSNDKPRFVQSKNR